MLPRKTQYLLHRTAMQEKEFILFNAQQRRHQPGRRVIHHVLYARMDAEISVQDTAEDGDGNGDCDAYDAGFKVRNDDNQTGEHADNRFLTYVS